MKRLIESVPNGLIQKITESTGEMHWTAIERPQIEGYRLFQYVACPILTQDQIDNTVLPQIFNVGDYLEYPAESSSLFQRMLCGSYSNWMVCERVARIQIAQNLNMFEPENN